MQLSHVGLDIRAEDADGNVLRAGEAKYAHRYVIFQVHNNQPIFTWDVENPTQRSAEPDNRLPTEGQPVPPQDQIEEEHQRFNEAQRSDSKNQTQPSPHDQAMGNDLGQVNEQGQRVAVAAQQARRDPFANLHPTAQTEIQ